MFRPSLMDPDLDLLDPEPRPAAEYGPNEGPLRVVPEGEATALLRIKLPDTPPVPATTLRSDAPPIARVYETAAMLAPVRSPARPTALPGDLLALTTATLVIPMPASRSSQPYSAATPRAGQRTALLTASVPPDFASRVEANLLSDTVEQFFGDFDAIGRGLAAQRAAVGAGVGDGDESSVDEPSGSGAEDYASGGRYGVPTQFPGYDATARRGPVGMRYLGGIFHDSSGASSFYDPETAALVPMSPGGQPPVTSAVPAAAHRAVPAPTPAAVSQQRPVASAPSTASAPPSAPPSAPRSAPRSAGSDSSAAPAPPPSSGHWADHHPDHRVTARSPRRRRLRRMTIAAVVSALACGGVYGASLALEGDVPRGTVADGVAIGGLTRLAAEAKLADALGPVLATPIRLTAGASVFTLPPDQAGLTIDWAATVVRAAADREDPFVSVPAVFGGRRTAVLVTSIDRVALRVAVAKATASFTKPMIDGGVTFPAGVPTPIAPTPGRSVDLDAAVADIATAFGASADGATAAAIPGRGAAVVPDGRLVAYQVALPEASAVPAVPPIPLHVAEVSPTVTPAVVAAAMQDVARPAMSAPITLVTGSIKTIVKPTVLAKYLAIVPDGAGGLVPKVDGVGLRAEIDKAALTRLERPAANAGFTVQGGKPVLVAGKPGTGYSPEAISAAAIATLAKPASQRAVAVQSGPLQPAFTSADADALAVRDVMGTYTIAFPAAVARSAAARHAADLLRGQIVQPGQTLSMNQVLGDTATTPDQGGTSLVATAVFNAEYLAGLRDAEHHPHNSVTAGFPAGMEAALAWPDVDLKLQNDSPTPVYVWTSATDTAVTVALLGQKVYDSVQTELSSHYAPAAAKTVSGTTGDCFPQDGSPGFQIDVTRILTKDGQPPIRQVFHTAYAAQDHIVCPSSSTAGGGGSAMATTSSSAPSGPFTAR